MQIPSEPARESSPPAFWPHLKFIGLSFLQTTSAIPVMLAYDLCRIALLDVDVDVEFYLCSHPDVARLVADGKYANSKDHYIQAGFFEGRPPFRIEVDPEHYLEANPDVKFAIDNGQMASAQAHFDQAGWKEGRSPSREFSLQRLPTSNQHC